MLCTRYLAAVGDFAFKSSPAVLKPAAASPYSLSWSPAPPCPPARRLGEPPPRPGSPPRGAFSSSLPLLLLPAQSPRRPRPPLRPPCPGWLNPCRWTTGRRACVGARPGWAPGG